MNNHLSQSEVILGVDTYLHTHVGAIVSSCGKLLGTLAVATDTNGYLKLLSWARSFETWSVPALRGQEPMVRGWPAYCVIMG